MKKLVCLISAGVMVVLVNAQVTSLCIATDKTTSLVFPYPIVHVDRGTQDVLAQSVNEADNVLLVKGAGKDFTETNLSVITKDGSIYSFKVFYDNNPSTWVYHLPVQTSLSVPTYANSILNNQRTMRGLSNKKWDMCSKINGIYIKNDVIYYQIQISNKSHIDYDIDFLRFYIRDKKKGKRTAIQENEVKPLYITGNIVNIKGQQKSTIVVALEKFTIPEAKYLAIEIGEKNGGRHLHLKLGNRQIINAITLHDLR